MDLDALLAPYAGAGDALAARIDAEPLTEAPWPSRPIQPPTPAEDAVGTLLAGFHDLGRR